MRAYLGLPQADSGLVDVAFADDEVSFNSECYNGDLAVPDAFYRFGARFTDLGTPGDEHAWIKVSESFPSLCDPSSG